MSSTVPRFDDWLNRKLEECAQVAGLDVETYVAHAVAAQMLADLKAADSPSVEEAAGRLLAAGVPSAAEASDISATIVDPARLRALYATGLLDSAPEEMYDRITRAAAAALDAPLSSMTLIDADRQYFKSSVGMDLPDPAFRETPLERSVCQYAVASGAPLVLDDMRADPVFKDHPAVVDGTVVAYLGIPLIDHDDNAIGTLCVFDVKPRQWGSGHIQVLSDLAKIATDRIFGPGPDPGLNA